MESENATKETKEIPKEENPNNTDNPLNLSPQKSYDHDKVSKIINKLIRCKEHNYANCVDLSEEEIRNIINEVYPILESQPVRLELKAPLCICGDIHGQFYDLLRIFEILEYPPKTTYLFLGDYVDRGKQSIETILLLFCLKIKYPEKIYLLRGNHESASVNKIYGFFDECKRRYSIRLHKLFSEVFNMLPFTAIVEEKILCMHGGLALNIDTIDAFKNILRPTEIPDSGMLCDLVWSDPSYDIVCSWGFNERGVSYTFSKDVVDSFTKKNDLDLICRAHQVVEEGYEFFGNMKLVTVFSAPNYCGQFDNNGGVLEVDENLVCKFHIICPISVKQIKRRERITKLVD